jgi:hypothetical protein
MQIHPQQNFLTVHPIFTNSISLSSARLGKMIKPQNVSNFYLGEQLRKINAKITLNSSQLAMQLVFANSLQIDSA